VGVRVLVVDDHPMITEGFVTMFELIEGLEPSSAGTGGEALAAIGASPPDVVLVDMHLPDMDGDVVAVRVRRLHPDVRIIIFTGGLSSDELARAVAAETDGILLKTTPLDDLVSAIRDVAAGKHVVDRELSGAIMNIARRGISPSSALSDREVEVVELLASGMTNKEIGRELFIAQTTVKSHLENIMRKLGVPDRTGAVAEAMRRGLVA
jgi:DNA-binding NarL/FixJ family response regulator